MAIFEAIFDRSSGEKLGIRTSKEGGSLYIKAIDDGAVKVWNDSQVDTSSEVRPGDRIIQVNGVSGDASLLSNECKQNAKLHVVIDGAPREVQIENKSAKDEVQAELAKDEVAFVAAKEEIPLVSAKEDDVEISDIIYEVLLDRSSGQKLGIRTSKGSKSLRVEAIDEGAVKVWNASHMFMFNEVQVGDRIVEVNGISGDAAALSNACKQNAKLQVKIQAARRVGMEGSSVGELVQRSGELVAPVAGKVLSWVGTTVGVLGETLSESLPETTKEQVKELAGNIGEVTQEKLGPITEKAAELAGKYGEVGKEQLGKLGETTKEIAGELGEVAKEIAADVRVAANQQVKEFAGGFGEAIRQPGKVHNFPSPNGQIRVVEQGALAHGCHILTSRAQCGVSNNPYDLRRLRVGGGGGGFVDLRDLLKLEREVHLMEHLKAHPHVVRSYATLVENWGKQHCRLLLCDPCVKCLESHVRVNGGVLSATETTTIGHQVAQGLQFLHGEGIVCGSVSARAVLYGTDHLWKLGDIGVSTDVPVTAEEWREAHRSNRLCKDEPPEVEVAAENKSMKVTTAADVWMLGTLLATAALGAHPFASPWHPPMACSDYTRMKEKTLFKPPARALLEPFRARLCLLITWMLENKPQHRLQIHEGAALLSTLAYTSAEELLQEMPEKVRVAFEDLIVSAANQLSKEESAGWALARLQVALTTKVVKCGSSPAPSPQTAGYPNSSPSVDRMDAEAASDLMDLTEPSKEPLISDAGATSDLDLTESSKELLISDAGAAHDLMDLTEHSKEPRIEQEAASDLMDFPEPSKEFPISDVGAASDLMDLTEPSGEFPTSDTGATSDLMDLSERSGELPISDAGASGDLMDLTEPSKELPISDAGASGDLMDLTEPSKELSISDAGVTSDLMDLTEHSGEVPISDAGTTSDLMDFPEPSKELPISDAGATSDLMDLTEPSKDPKATRSPSPEGATCDLLDFPEPSKELLILDDGAASDSTEDVRSSESDGNSSDTESDGCSKERPLLQADSDMFCRNDFDNLISDPIEEPCTKTNAGTLFESNLFDPCAKTNAETRFEGNPFDEESPYAGDLISM